MRRHRSSVALQEIKKFEHEESDESLSTFDDEKIVPNRSNKHIPNTHRRQRKRRIANNDEGEENNYSDESPTQGTESTSKKKRIVLGPVVYTPGGYYPELQPQVGNDVQVLVLARYLVFNNDQVKSNQIWGSGPYTVDSDVVCILQHSGIYSLTPQEPNFCLLKVTLRIYSGMESYEGGERHGIKSNHCGAGYVSISPEKTEFVQDPDPTMLALISSATSALSGMARHHHPNHHVEQQQSPEKQPCSATRLTTNNNRQQLDLQQSLSSTLASPLINQSIVFSGNSSDANTGTKTGRGGGVNHVFKKDVTSDENNTANSSEDANYLATFVNVFPETILQFNLSNELCFQYNLVMTFDHGVSPRQWTSYRLKKVVLVLESFSTRHELSLEDRKFPIVKVGRSLELVLPPSNENNQHDKSQDQSIYYDTYRWAKVKYPIEKNYSWYMDHTIPLDLEYIDVIEQNLDWSQIVWTEKSVYIKGVEYEINKLFWLERHERSNSTLETTSSVSKKEPIPIITASKYIANGEMTKYGIL